MSVTEKLKRLERAWLMLLEQEDKCGPYNPVIEHAKIALKCSACAGYGVTHYPTKKCSVCEGKGWHL